MRDVTKLVGMIYSGSSIRRGRGVATIVKISLELAIDIPSGWDIFQGAQGQDRFHGPAWKIT